MSYYGNRNSIARNPDRELSATPAAAPGWALQRVVRAQDADFKRVGHGVVMSEYEKLRFAVTPMTEDPTTDESAEPGGSVNPSIEIRIWSEPAKQFVPMHDPITRAGAGAGVPFVVDVPNANGATIGCFVTNAISGFVTIAAQGYKLSRD